MVLGFFAYIVIPVYTILFAQGDSWFSTNFSVIGNGAGRKEAFILWGLMIGIYFFYSLQKIVAQMRIPPGGIWLIPFSLVLLTCAILTPYLPEKLPLKSLLHIIFSFLSAVCLLLCLLTILWKLYQQDSRKYRPYLIGLAGITAFSLLLLFLAGIVSSALEIFFTIASVCMVRRLYLTLMHSPG